eukprot:3227183-Amphidinium_carterae.1
MSPWICVQNHFVLNGPLAHDNSDSLMETLRCYAIGNADVCAVSCSLCQDFALAGAPSSCSWM